MDDQQQVVIVDEKGVEHVFPAGFDPKRAAAIVRQGGNGSAQANPDGQKVDGSTFAEKLGNAAKQIGVALPAAGGIVGGIAGGVPGAIVGGAVGEGYRQLAEHATEIPGAIKDVASNLLTHPIATAEGAVSGQNAGAVSATTEGLAQGAGQGIGEGLAAGGGVMAKWLMNRATTRVSAKLMQEFPELSDTLLDNALTVSKGGYAQARALLMTAKGKATAALTAADKSGATLPLQMNGDIAESLKTAILEKLVKSGRVPAPQAGQPITIASERLDPATRALFTNIDTAAANGGALDLLPSQADLLKTQLQKESRALYANRTAPNGPKAMGMDATERAELATQLNNGIDSLAPGYKAGNAEAKPLIGATRGIQQAIRPNGNLMQAMVRPAVGAIGGGLIGQQEGGNYGAAGGSIAGAALTSPAGMSREAIILASPVMQGVLKALPKPLAQGLMDLLATHLTESQSPGQGR